MTCPEAICESLADRLATARTRYLMGDHAEAREMLQAVRLDYLRFRDVLRGMPGDLALRRGLESAEGVMGI